MGANLGARRGQPRRPAAQGPGPGAGGGLDRGGPRAGRVTNAQDRVDNPDTAPRAGGRRRDPDRTGKRPDPTPQADITDPDSGIMPTKDGWVQGYNVWFGITADQIIWATEVSTNPADVVSYDTMVTKITDTPHSWATPTRSAPCSSTPATRATPPSPPPAPTD